MMNASSVLSADAVAGPRESNASAPKSSERRYKVSGGTSDERAVSGSQFGWGCRLGWSSVAPSSERNLPAPGPPSSIVLVSN